MFKKTLLATVTTAALLGPVAAFAAGEMGQGTITFTGSVTEAPCSVSAADTNLAIDLGQVSKNLLTGTGKFGTAVPIEIHLTGCSFAAPAANATAAPLSKVSVSFPGLTSTTGMVPNTGNATNVAIQMLNRDNTNLNFTTGSSETEMRNGDGSLQLFARIASNSATAAGAGSVTAKVTYMLNYK
ncbi:fimbrial protein [Achromobacter ruhlandii]|uniref:Fimbrial protein n=1 Tax=Achromobacter ruhlandii TaxID=72557 RepID=A0A848NE79_9BURK|nr:fimbrial protein [Achromobacter ruhlandii]MEB6664679.1 fimbrial protein [Achromobacter ruhlandii]NMU89434.1 fimbrial protein [Achromobacter ruhlandii]CAB3839899.1 putative fimbrial-like protein YbgD [Achromobacter ruhlandii]